jgi:predicted nucleotidyltransferase
MALSHSDSMTHSFPAAKMARWRATAQARQAEAALALEQRRVRAWESAAKSADLLRQQFGATRILLFGSLVHQLWFTPTSDIDLAAVGIPPERFFAAVAQLQDISADFRIDLVDLDRCPPPLRELIEQEGHSL